MNVGARPVFAKDIRHMRPKRPPVSERQQNPRTDLLGQIDSSSLDLLIRQSCRHRHRDTLPTSNHALSRHSSASRSSRIHKLVTVISGRLGSEANLLKQPTIKRRRATVPPAPKT